MGWIKPDDVMSSILTLLFPIWISIFGIDIGSREGRPREGTPLLYFSPMFATDLKIPSVISSLLNHNGRTKLTAEDTDRGHHCHLCKQPGHRLGSGQRSSPRRWTEGTLSSRPWPSWAERAMALVGLQVKVWSHTTVHNWLSSNFFLFGVWLSFC